MNTTENFSDRTQARLSRSEVADKLQSITDLHGIGITGEHLVFSGIRPCSGAGKADPPADGPVTIRMDEIASITPFSGRIELLLRSGVMYVFSTTDTVKTCINTYNEAGGKAEKSRSTTPQEIAGNIWDGLEKTLAGKK